MIFDARLAIATAAVVATAGFCAWQLSTMAEKVHHNEKTKMLVQQVAAVRGQVETQLEKSANDLTALIQSQIAAPEATPEFLKSEFLALAVVSAAPGQPWAIEWTRAKSDQLSKPFLDTQLNYWALDRLKGDDLQMLRLETPDRRVYFVLSVQIRFKSATGEDVKVAVGILPSVYFAGIADAVKGTADELIIVDAAGYSYAYTDPQYVGAKMDPHPLVKSLMKSPTHNEFRPTFTLGKVPALGGFEKLKNGNLYVLMSSPVPSREKTAWAAFMQVGVVTVAMALLTAICILIFNQRESMHISRLENRLKVLDQRAQQPQEVKVYQQDKERVEAMRDLAFSVIQYLRAPISAILGQAQIGQSKADLSAARESFVQIEKAARQSRDFLEGLAKSNGFERLDLKPLGIDAILQQSLNHVRQSLEKADVKIEENYKTNALAEVAPVELRSALQGLLLYFSERLSHATGLKRLQVDIEQAGSLIRLRFADSGVSPAPEQIRRFFEPFATAGLQMATLRSLVEHFRGTVRADKNDPQGLKIEIDLPQFIPIAAKEPEMKVAELRKAASAPPSAQAVTPTAASAPPSVVTPAQAPTAPPPPPVKNTLPAKESEPVITPEPTVLGGKPALDDSKAPNLPPAPQPTATDVKVKEELSAAEELSVVIRKPRIRTDV